MSTVKRCSPRDWREERRPRAWALHEQGWTGKAIAEALGVSQGAHNWWCLAVVLADNGLWCQGPFQHPTRTGNSLPPGERGPFCRLASSQAERSGPPSSAFFDVRSGRNCRPLGAAVGIFRTGPCRTVAAPFTIRQMKACHESPNYLSVQRWPGGRAASDRTARPAVGLWSGY